MSHLSSTQMKGLLAVGDVLVPGDGELPSFSSSGCAAHADRMLAHMTEADRGGVQALLTMFRFLPRFAVRAGSLISDAGSLPAALAPSCSQNSPRTASQPSGAVNSTTRVARYFSISAR